MAVAYQMMAALSTKQSLLLVQAGLHADIWRLRRIMRQKRHSPKKGQQGITLVEALMALLILALGVLGLIEMEARMLVETRITNSRATAIRLMADLSERIRINATGAQPQLPVQSGSVALSPYADAGDQAKAPYFPAPDSLSAPSCNPARGSVCAPKQGAAYDVWDWRQQVADGLLNGRASILQVDLRQLQIIVAWQANENTHPALSGTPAAADQSVADELQITDGAGTPVCPRGFICHIDSIAIPPVQ